MRRLVVAGGFALLVGFGVGVQSYGAGFAAGLRRAETVLQPSGLIVLRDDGGCDRYMDGVTHHLNLDRPHRAQFVTAIWPVGPGAK